MTRKALCMSDRIVVMRDGKIEQDGTPREIYEEPKNLFVASFMARSISSTPRLSSVWMSSAFANVEGREYITVNFAAEKGHKLNVLLRPEDCASRRSTAMRKPRLIGYIRERKYKDDAGIRCRTGKR